MGVGADDLGMNEGRAFPHAAIADRLAHGLEARDRIAAVDLEDEEIGERAHQLADAAARGLDLDRNRDRVAVVLHQVDHGQLQVAGGVEAFPELAFGGGAVAGADEDDLVMLERGQRPRLLHEQARLGAAHGLEELGADR